MASAPSASQRRSCLTPAVMRVMEWHRQRPAFSIHEPQSLAEPVPVPEIGGASEPAPPQQRDAARPDPGVG